MMRKLLLVVVLFFACTILKSSAQTLGNEWINYNQSYYKFKVFQDGMYRIPIASLTAAGFPASVAGTSLQLFRDGVEVPIYVSNNATLAATDYIEFYGEKANGNLDKRLFADSTTQLNPYQNLVSDTAFYFITINTLGTHLRYTQRTNVLTSLPAKENYIWRTELINYRSGFAAGPSAVEGQYQVPEMYTLNSSQYEYEGFIRSFTTVSDTVLVTCVNPYTDSGTPNGKFISNVAGQSYIPNHEIQVYANATMIADSFYSKFNFTKIRANVPMAAINTTTNQFKFGFTPSSSIGDRYGISFVRFQYPSKLDLANATNLYFELDPKATGYYLEISNFNKGTEKPRLYDITAKEYLIGDTSISGLVRYFIPASTVTKKMYLQSQVSATLKSVVGIENILFKNYTLASNQGNFIMIADKRYQNDGNGNNYIEAYRAYRSTPEGGGYTAIAPTLQDIYNEFGYGYDFSVLGMKNLLNYAQTSTNWSLKPKNVLIVGKGLEYTNYLNYKAASTTAFPFYVAPTFGQPGSDWLFTDFSKTNLPQIPIGRLSVFAASDINVYLQKVKDFEAGRASTIQTSDNKLWQKRVLHISGIHDSLQSLPVVSALEREKTIIEGTYFGGNASVLTRSTNDNVEYMNNKIIDSFYNNGSAIIYFFGHSSATSIDYGLDFPDRYTNTKKYPLMIANGCGAGNIFIFTGQKYLSERYVTAPEKGAIGFIGSINSGFTGNLGYYTDSLYGQIAKLSYGKCIGEQMQKNIIFLMTNPSVMNDLLFKVHAQQILLNGDPHIKLSTASLPDYIIEAKNIKLSPAVLCTSLDSIDVEVTLNNLGTLTTDSVQIEIKRILPDGNTKMIVDTKVPAFNFEKIYKFKIPTLGNLGAGANSLIVSIDKLNTIAEISETNNTITKNFVIANTGAFPVYPPEYGIINTQGVVLKSTTKNIFETMVGYKIQLDTTENFNSPLLQTTTINSTGGVIDWQPTITYQNGVVYYWRIAPDVTNPIWEKSSFIYLTGSTPGWNQSDYFQFKDDQLNGIQLDSSKICQFGFSNIERTIQSQNVCLSGPNPSYYLWADFFVKIDGSSIYSFGCDPWPGYSSLQVVVIDPKSGKTWKNTRPNPLVAGGQYGSYDPCRIVVNGVVQDPFFQFDFTTAANRLKLINFLNIIPNGNYVMVQPQLCVGAECGSINSIFINNWKKDTTTLGSNNSLYHTLKNMGFTKIDSFTKNRPMIFWTKKGDATTVQQVIGKDLSEKLFGEFKFLHPTYTATITSTKIGPASRWENFERSLSTCDADLLGDKTYFEIYGTNADNKEQLIATVVNDTSLAFIDANVFPTLTVKMITTDSLYYTPAQLDFWRIHYVPVPEGSFNPNALYTITDGTTPNTKNISVAFENLTSTPMDSLLVTFTILDKFDNVYFTETRRIAGLPALDTIHINYTLNTANLYSNWEFQIEVNPINDQVEQFHPNNFALRSVALIDPTIPLPVTLNNFTVSEDNCNTKVYWNTSDEINLSHYELERKEKNGYQKIAEILPINNNNTIKEYSYTDKLMTPSSLFYRLKMVDIDQKYKYSNEKYININCNYESELISIYPNPATANIAIDITSNEAKDYSIKIMDALGFVVYKNVFEIVKGKQSIPISVQHLATGVYTIVVFDGEKNHTIKLTKE